MNIAVALALLAAALFGAATPLSKILLSGFHPVTLAGLLYAGAGLALAPRALRDGFVGRFRRMNGRNRLLVLGSVVAGGIAGPVLLLFGLRIAASASVSLWLNLELVATSILGHFLFNDRMSPQSALATLGIIAASVLLSFEGGETSLYGGLLVAAACVCWGFDNHFTALIDGIKPADGTFVKGSVAGLTNLVAGFLIAGASGVRLSSCGSALAIGALSYGLSIVLYVSAAQGLGASRAQLFFSASPLFGLALAAIVLGESFSAAQIAAASLMILSYVVLAFERHGHAHAHPALVHTHWHRHGEGHHVHGHERLGLMARLLGHSHEHAHEETAHVHEHVSDIHHRHAHG